MQANLLQYRPPISEKISDVDGSLSNQWQRYFNNLYQYMQSNLSPAGFVLPSMNTSTRDNLTNVLEGAVIYNTDVPAGQIYQSGGWKTIQAV